MDNVFLNGFADELVKQAGHPLFTAIKNKGVAIGQKAKSIVGKAMKKKGKPKLKGTALQRFAKSRSGMKKKGEAADALGMTGKPAPKPKETSVTAPVEGRPAPKLPKPPKMPKPMQGGQTMETKPQDPLDKTAEWGDENTSSDEDASDAGAMLKALMEDAEARQQSGFTEETGGSGTEPSDTEAPYFGAGKGLPKKGKKKSVTSQVLKKMGFVNKEAKRLPKGLMGALDKNFHGNKGLVERKLSHKAGREIAKNLAKGRKAGHYPPQQQKLDVSIWNRNRAREGLEGQPRSARSEAVEADLDRAIWRPSMRNPDHGYSIQGTSADKGALADMKKAFGWK